MSCVAFLRSKGEYSITLRLKCCFRDLDAVELQEDDSIMCCASAAITTMQFQPKWDGLLVHTIPYLMLNVLMTNGPLLTWVSRVPAAAESPWRVAFARVRNALGQNKCALHGPMMCGDTKHIGAFAGHLFVLLTPPVHITKQARSFCDKFSHFQIPRGWEVFIQYAQPW